MTGADRSNLRAGGETEKEWRGSEVSGQAGQVGVVCSRYTDGQAPPPLLPTQRAPATYAVHYTTV